jgi:hypothetical protein
LLNETSFTSFYCLFFAYWSVILIGSRSEYFGPWSLTVSELNTESSWRK